MRLLLPVVFLAQTLSCRPRTVMATSSTSKHDPIDLNDRDGFDPYRDTVGAGIYGGNVKRNADGSVLWGRQYQNHNPVPGPVYDGTGYSEMSRTVQTGNPESIRSLLAKKPELLTEITTGGALPLHMCGMSRTGQMVTQALIDAGADIEAMDTYGYRPLHRMASNNLAVGAEALLKAGADPSAKTGKPYSGDTPLGIARQSNAADVIKVLARYGAK